MVGEVIAACFTPGDYARVVEEHLLPSVRALRLSYDIREMPTRGSWLANTTNRLDFAWALCVEYPSIHFLFLDVDAVVRSDPWSFLRSLDCDIGVHFFRGREMLGGTIYLPAGPRRLEIVNHWKNEPHPRHKRWHQSTLQRVIERDHTIRVAHLPPEYCCIFDLQRKLTPDIIPVIEHFQASRQYRRAPQ